MIMSKFDRIVSVPSFFYNQTSRLDLAFVVGCYHGNNVVCSNALVYPFVMNI
jgi:hypothetical protein